jgi:hypothetical protein
VDMFDGLALMLVRLEGTHRRRRFRSH